MLSMDIIAEIRRRHLVSGESISAIARSLKLSRPTVRKHLHTTAEPVYARQQQPSPKLGEFQVMLQRGAYRIRKKSYAKVFRLAVAA